MKVKQLLCTSVFLVASLPVYAATVDGSASIVLNEVSAGSGMSFNLTGINTYSGITSVNFGYPGFDDSNTVIGATESGTLVSTFANSSSQANAIASTELFVGEPPVPGEGAASNASVFNAGNASSSTLSVFSFDVTGTGDITFSFDYDLSANILDGLGSEYSTAIVSASFEETADPAGVQSILLENIQGNDGLSASDIFSLTLSVDESYSGFIFLSSSVGVDSAVAPVPVPAAAWLFATGLLGLVGVKRRKQA